ncbi:MAG: DNA repair protein RecN [Lachnospiraceae bacterium]|nr:DNA repair protein RecN [Lachnospiraceae bacterium]
MLLNLHVKNFALIEEADLDLGSGLNVLTGETGAGKSLLIDAVGAALGGRCGSDVIRHGAPFAYTELVFEVSEEEKKEQLQAMDISTEYDCIVISRKILPGRSVHKINDETVTSQKVRAVTALLLDMHGQHEHQSLIRKEKQLDILDQFGGAEIERAKEHMAKAYSAYMNARKYLGSLAMDPEERRRELDFLSYEISEIEEAGMKEGELEELERKFRRMNNARRIGESLAEAENCLTSGEPSAEELLSHASKCIAGIASMDEGAEPLMEILAQTEDLLSEAVRELYSYKEELTFDPEEFRETEERLDELHRIHSKYGSSYEDVMTALSDRKQREEELLAAEGRKKEAEAAFAEQEKVLKRCAEELTLLRKRQIPMLAERLASAIRELNFPYVELFIRQELKNAPARDGQDTVEFLISLNEGEEEKPLASVASGGELSRIMLAIKAVLADRDEIPTLIFDEIDTGISGRTAQKVSEKLSEIGRFRQVICISHLPQIAAMADHHYLIEKRSAAGSTSTKIRALSDKEAVDELARLLGGSEITETVYQNAHEMKLLAEKKKHFR